MQRKEVIQLKKKESDEWLCSNSYKPKKFEIIEKKLSKQKGKRKINKLKMVEIVNPKKCRSNDFSSNEKVEKPMQKDFENDIKSFEETHQNYKSQRKKWDSKNKTPTSSKSPLFIKRISLRDSDDSLPMTMTRQSPSEVFAELTPKRKKIALKLIEIDGKKEEKMKENEKKEKGEEDDLFEDESDHSEISNVLENITPIKNKFAEIEEDLKLKKNYIKFGDFQTAFDIQKSISACSSIEMFEEKANEDFPIFAIPSNIKKAKIDLSEKIKNINQEEFELEHLIEESCSQFPILPSVSRSYIIEDTQNEIYENKLENISESSNSEEVFSFTQRIKKAEETNEEKQNRNVIETLTVYEKNQIIPKDELVGLAAQFASMMATKANERQLLLSDMRLGIVPQRKMIEKNVKKYERAFGVLFLELESPNCLILTNPLQIRRLSPFPNKFDHRHHPLFVFGGISQNSAQFSSSSVATTEVAAAAASSTTLSFSASPSFHLTNCVISVEEEAELFSEKQSVRSKLVTINSDCVIKSDWHF